MHELMDTITRTKTKHNTIRKTYIRYFFSAVYHNKTYVMPQPPIHLGRNFEYNAEQQQQQQQQYASQFLQIQLLLKTIRKNVINCDSDFRLNYALNCGHFGHHRKYFILLNQTNVRF